MNYYQTLGKPMKMVVFHGVESDGFMGFSLDLPNLVVTFTASCQDSTVDPLAD